LVGRVVLPDKSIHISKDFEGITMKSFAQSVQKFLASEDGPTAVEYAVMLALIVIVCLTAIQAIGTNANSKFEEVGTALSGST
jgi:pilus assembly protein Flp/PilA